MHDPPHKSATPLLKACCAVKGSQPPIILHITDDVSSRKQRLSQPPIILHSTDDVSSRKQRTSAPACWLNVSCSLIRSTIFADLDQCQGRVG
ncbi:hypothetical protein FRX31_005297 [Thalictrum thalictroides]|uniref:Uncharacterized protein n=1 Tax=Thalictrum thalictroides TaxID=46969 RepID=A0A7J6X5M6_THATH|nr:hypothetical protein FRX31_005297 [Thalictrum thalictroides]